MAFRNTLSVVWADFFAYMQELENTHGAGSTLDIRKVAEGEGVYDEYPVPFLLVQLLDSEPDAKADGDKLWQQRIKLRMVTETATEHGATVEILSKIGHIEDKIEAYPKPDGTAGWEDAKWSITYSMSPTHGNLVVAESIRNFTVMVTRGAN